MKKNIVGRFGWVATTGLKQHPFHTPVMGCLVGCATIGKPERTIIGKTQGEPNFRTKKLSLGGWAGDDHNWKTKTNHHWQHTRGTTFPKQKNNHWEGLGRRRFGSSHSCFRHVLGCLPLPPPFHPPLSRSHPGTRGETKTLRGKKDIRG